MADQTAPTTTDQIEPTLKYLNNEPPPLTEWKPAFGLPCCWKTLDPTVFFCNFQFVQLKIVDLVIVYNIIAQFIWMKYVYPNLSTPYSNIMMVYTYFTMIYAIGNITSARYINPGFLPWNWSVTKKRTFTKNELRSGFALNDEQDEWAKSHESPKRAWFSSNIGYFILRGDHYCSWAGSFIGLYNHRYFLMAIIGFSLYIDGWLVCLFYLLYQHKLHMSWLYAIPLFAIGFFFAYLANMNVLNQLFLLHNNTTLIEHLKKKDFIYYHDSCLEGFVEICGSKKYMALWLCPCPLPREVDGFDFEEGPYKLKSEDDDAETKPFL